MISVVFQGKVCQPPNKKSPRLQNLMFIFPFLGVFHLRTQSDKIMVCVSKACVVQSLRRVWNSNVGLQRGAPAWGCGSMRARCVCGLRRKDKKTIRKINVFGQK